ncbi:death-inducer obliterator 1 isoform X3 [Hyposmocoma kahamanoa]|nr:death-inducer obliterator 1 isoform X3 [Hyposmocoma kahamanoa]
MLQSLRIETRENSLVGFQNDHCYTPLTSPSQGVPQRSDSYSGYDEPVLEITHTPPPKPVPQSKKITILEEQIIPKGKKIIINPTDSSLLLKCHDVLSKPLPVLPKSKNMNDLEKSSETTESSSISSEDSIPDRDSDSDYKDAKDKTSLRSVRKPKVKPRILKNIQVTKPGKLDPKIMSRVKSGKNILRRDVKERVQQKSILIRKQQEPEPVTPKETILGTTDIPVPEIGKVVSKHIPKPIKKEKKTPAHMTALLSDMTSLFSTPDVIRRVSTDGKNVKPEKEPAPPSKKGVSLLKLQEPGDAKTAENIKLLDSIEKAKNLTPKTYTKQKDRTVSADKTAKSYDLIPQLDDVSLAQILQDTTGISTTPKAQPNITTSNTVSSPGLAGPLSPTLDLLGGLQPEEEGLTEDLLMHVAQLVESSENLQEVIDKQVLGKVDTVPAKSAVQSPFQQAHAANDYQQTPTRSAKTILPRKDPIEIVRRDGRVITLPPIEAPATRSSKRKSQMETSSVADTLVTPIETPPPPAPLSVTPEPQVQHVSKQYINRKLTVKKQEPVAQTPVVDKLSAESQESWNSEDDPNRLWCICKQPHNNRFMICCDGCEDWFHGKCVNITKAMGQQMEERGIEWRCPNCIKKAKPTPKSATKVTSMQKKIELNDSLTATQSPLPRDIGSKTVCIVCKRPARASSIYCSDSCILKHAQDSLGNQTSPNKSDMDPGKSQEKQKSDSRVIVYERKTGRLLAGPNAPTAENLKTWLQKNPTFEVVRPGTLHTIKPNLAKKKSNEPGKIQTTLNFERIPRKSAELPMTPKTPQQEPKEKITKVVISPREEIRPIPQPRTPVMLRSQLPDYQDTPRPSTSTAKLTEPKKPLRATATRSQSTYEKTPTVSVTTSRRKETPDAKKKMDSTEPIRDNVRKSLQEQMSIRMTENTGPKFNEEQIKQYAFATESELYELFSRDVGVKYKAKYRSLMFNIKDRKNLSLWQKICDGTITPKQLVRLSPEELASQELAEWRDQEAKHQLELIKKSELDLLAASKTYVLKTHKGEEVMETKESVSTELDPNVPVEDVVIALNDSTVGEQVTNEAILQPATEKSKEDKSEKHSRKRNREDSIHSKKSRRDSKRDSDIRKSRSSRRRSDDKETREGRSTRRSAKKSSRARSLSRDKFKIESKDKEERSKHRSRSRSRAKSKKRSKTPQHSRSRSKDTSRSRARSKKRSPSREDPKRRRSTRTKHSSSTEEVTHRSRSQENISTKSKNDSTDSDSIERPKSAMLKEVHPEYDPHEPMITSAFSEEDLRKSGGDSYEDTYKNEITDYGDTEYSKAFSIEADDILPPQKCPLRADRVSEAESDQEPSSTVDNAAVAVWNGCINMVDVARFYVAAHEVSGNAADLEEDLTAELDIVGRINPDTVWDYIGKMKRASNKDIIILRLQAANDEEKMQYIALYSYLSSRNRLGVVKVSNTTNVKDFYIVPLPSNTTLPSVLLPLDGPGLGEVKTHLLLAIVIRQRKKRHAPHIPKDHIPAKVARESRKRSYTPPVVGKSTYTPPASPRRRTAATPVANLPLPTYTSPALSTSVKDKIAATLASANDEEPYSPGSSSSSNSGPPSTAPASTTLRSKMDELNRQIEEQKQQILKMAQADSSVGEDEAYSPSRPMTPPSVVPLADIALPSNLQEILATIKQRSEPTTGDVDMRNLPLP